jgi:hypothetical protein
VNYEYLNQIESAINIPSGLHNYQHGKSITQARRQDKISEEEKIHE